MSRNIDATQGPESPGMFWRILWPLAVLLLGFYLVPLAQTCQLDCVPGDLGDARFNGAILEHFYQWLTGHEKNLLSPSFFYPMPGALTFSDTQWGAGSIYAAFRHLGWNRYVAFDLWYLTGYLLNFGVCHWVFRKLRFSPAASAIGAFAFTFAMPVIVQYGHAQLTYRFFIPLGLYFWQSFRGSGRWRWPGALVLAIVAQFYVSLDLGCFMLFFMAAWIIAQWIFEGWGPSQWFGSWRQWNQHGVATELFLSLIIMAVAIVGLVALVHPYVHYQMLYGFQRSVGNGGAMLPHLQSYLMADESTIWGSWSSRSFPSVPLRQEQQMFLGLGIISLAIMGLCYSAARLRWVALASVLMLVLLTLNVGGHSIYATLDRLTGFGAVRVVSRIGLVMIMPVALLVALGVDSKWRVSKEWRMAILLLAAFMVREAGAMKSGTFAVAEAQARTDRLKAKLTSPLPVDAVFFNPVRPDEDSYLSELDGVVLAQDMGRPTLNGYSGYTPSGYAPLASASGCSQASARLQGAADFYAQRADHGVAPTGGTLVVIGNPPCSPATLHPFPLSEAARITVRIDSVQRVGTEYLVRVSVHNGSRYELDTATAEPEPLRLSWQEFPSHGKFASDAWQSRVDLREGGALKPGETREVQFAMPALPAGQSELAVSLVLEGRSWLHDHGMQPALHDLTE